MSNIFDAMQAWGDMGDAVTEQALAVRDGDPLSEQNPNALKMIRDWANRYRDIDEDIADFADELEDESRWTEDEDQ